MWFLVTLIDPAMTANGGKVDKEPTDRPDEVREEQNQGDRPAMDPDPVADDAGDNGDAPSASDAFRSG